MAQCLVVWTTSMSIKTILHKFASNFVVSKLWNYKCKLDDNFINVKFTCKIFLFLFITHFEQYLWMSVYPKQTNHYYRARQNFDILSYDNVILLIAISKYYFYNSSKCFLSFLRLHFYFFFLNTIYLAYSSELSIKYNLNLNPNCGTKQLHCSGIIHKRSSYTLLERKFFWNGAWSESS